MTINLRSKNLNRRRRDAEKYALKYRVYADGVDVTNRCFYFDGRRRIFGLNLLNDKGQPYLTADRKEIATEVIKARRVRLVKK